MASNSPNSLVEIGALIGEYKVTALCSDGPSAQVFRAEHTRFLRKAAVKVLSQSIPDAAERSRIKGLLGRASQVRHSNVAELYDFGFLEDKHLYMVLEWVDGLALDDEDGKFLSLPIGERFSLLASIADAIDEVHMSELSLGRLNNSQIIVDSKRGRPKLIAYSLFEDIASGKIDSSGGKAGDYQRLGKLIERLLLTGSESLADDVAEKIEVIIARCSTTEKSDQYSSASSVAREVKAALGLEAPRNSTLEIGTLVGDSYKITGVIGKGGMGQVYEGVHVRLPQRVAIKVIDGTFTEEANIRFRQEAEIAASIGHPHLVRVIDFNTFEDDRPYMVMELLEGEDLGKSMRYGPLSPKRAIEIARQVGSALTAVHKKGIVHRDLKPPNVFLGKVAVGGEFREHATVLDFGVSKREDATISVTKTSAVVGTPQYMAPEQALGENDTLTAKADQFSLGSLLYEMLSGAPAFGRGTLAEVVYRVCQEEPIPLKLLFPDLPESVSDAVQRAMSKRAEDRFDSVANFVAELSKDPVKDEALVSSIPIETLRGVATPGDSSDAATVANKKSNSAAPTAETAVATKSGVGPGKPVSPAETLAAAATEKDVSAAIAANHAPAEGESSARSKWGFVLAAIGGAGALIVAFVLVTGGGEGQEASETVNPVATMVQPADASAPMPPDAGSMAAQESTDAAAAPAEPDAGVLDAGTAVEPTPIIKKPRTPKSPDLPKEIVAKLDEASRLIEAKNYRKARQIVSRDKRAAATNRGRALAVKSYCGENNFGAAQAWLRKLPRRERRAVIAYCKKAHQMELN